ncbi:tRNA-uridine aminocarboxypropyltransferase 1 [Anabrus simplex]|uniref:tRNA-uridine aminocarboxypropyltransferase 1 n=1 Tax=Anabrus simplex TaxID=316456 RepID=UPI0034DD4C91
MNPKLEESRRNVEDPFKDLKIADTAILDDIDQRSLCPKCKKSRKYFCYTCYVPVEALEGRVPVVKLPLKIDIIKHNREIDGKSTAAHAAVLAPDDVTIYTFPCVPEYDSDEKVVVIYPGKDAVSLEDYVKPFSTSADTEPRVKRLNCGPGPPITRAIFIDSTWNQSRGIFKDPRLHSLPCVVLEHRLSQFWRHQNGSPRWYLATIEAVHQFLVELHGQTESESYSGQYDNLLYFFKYMYHKIHTLYDHEDLKAYKRSMF